MTGSARTHAVGIGLLLSLTLQNTMAPFATDTYTPAFPQVTTELGTTASLVGLTMTTFFIGMAAGQFFGGPLSDRFGRRGPMIIGGIVCLVGGVLCAVAPSSAMLIIARMIQGIGGGMTAVAARAILVDLARGDQLARVMSIFMSLGGLAPMVAPVVGGLVLSGGGTWRTVFWVLAGLAIVMVATAIVVVPESLPRELRRTGGGELQRSIRTLAQNRLFIGAALTSACSAFTMLAYIANSSYVLQGMKGMAPLAFSLFFASTALTQVALSVVNARLVGRFRPRSLITFGLSVSAGSVLLLAIGVLLLDTPLILTCIGFLALMGSQAFILGNAGATAAAQAPEIAGAVSAVIGVAQAIAMAIAAPLASLGGTETASPMIVVMAVGLVLSLGCHLVIARPARTPVEQPLD